MKPQIKQRWKVQERKGQNLIDMEEEDEGLKIVGPVQPVNLLLNIF